MLNSNETARKNREGSGSRTRKGGNKCNGEGASLSL
jgi:hypothetical protein